jgi:hypothetical protein
MRPVLSQKAFEGSHVPSLPSQVKFFDNLAG